MTYYNEIDPKAAAWLRELMSAGLIPSGHVDTRSIIDVQPNDLAGFDQCHFFAGIGGWAYALRLAGWPDDEPVWTGSCPCQPFSAAGKQRGTADERHLWPVFAELIRKCRPSTVFGEQVASKLGREWLAGVRLDLEGMGYAVGAADLCAAGVGAPHIRQRLYWVADARHQHTGRAPRSSEAQGWGPFGDSTGCGDACGLADAESQRCRETGKRRGRQEEWSCDGGESCGVEHATGDGRSERRTEPSGRGVVGGCGAGGVGDAEVIGRPGRQDGEDGGRGQQSLGHTGEADRVADVRCAGLEGRAEQPAREECQAAQRSGNAGWVGDSELHGCSADQVGRSIEPGANERRVFQPQGSNPGFWSRFDVVQCRDGKARRFEPISFWLADGLSEGVDEVRDSWDVAVQKIKETIIDHAKTTGKDPSEVLRALRKHYGKDAVQWALGGQDSLPKEAFLFAALCELPRKLGIIIDGETPGISETPRTELRGLREEGARKDGASCPPPGREHPQQLTEQLADIMRGLPPKISLAHSFPLIRGAVHRVGLLRGYGNAIVPQVAAEFIRAFCESVTQ